jgi:hypothetical protein
MRSRVSEGSQGHGEEQADGCDDEGSNTSLDFSLGSDFHVAR